MDAKTFIERRARAWEAAKAINDAAETEGRDLSAEEDASFSKAMADIDALDVRIKSIVDAEKRNAEIAASLKDLGLDKRDQAPAPSGAEVEVRRFLNGERRSLDVTAPRALSQAEFRDLSKLTAGAGANTVKASFYEMLVAHLIEVSGIMQAGPTILNTTTGEQIQVPKTTSHSTAALIVEAASLTESDPVFGQVPLDAFKYAMSIQVSNELVNDSSVDLLGYLAMQCGRAVGNAFGTHAITGTGSSQPNGIATAATTGVTGAAAVVGAFSADNLIDLFYSVISPYRNSPSCAWLMRDATLANVRKLKDTTNQYLWQPALTVGAPDMLLGKPLYTDPNVAAVALSARSVLFGDISQYYVRMVNGIRFERSDDFAFQNDLVTFRCILRADGDLIDTTGAVKAFVGNAA
jgi:HK97 family phage major capsid protein